MKRNTSKITLNALPETIAMAKQLASEHKTSVSALFAKIIRDLHQLEHLTAPSRFHHAVEDLLGSADGWPTDMSYDEIIRQAKSEAIKKTLKDHTTEFPHAAFYKNNDGGVGCGT